MRESENNEWSKERDKLWKCIMKTTLRKEKTNEKKSVLLIIIGWCFKNYTYIIFNCEKKTNKNDVYHKSERQDINFVYFI